MERRIKNSPKKGEPEFHAYWNRCWTRMLEVMWCNETFACRPHLSLQRETSNDNDIYETPRQTSVMDQWVWLRYCCICAVKFFQNQNKCFGAQCFCKPSQKPWAFLNFPCAVLVMAIQLSKRLFGLPWKKQESSFQKVQQRFQVFAWLPSRCQFLELHGDLNPPICRLDALRFGRPAEKVDC